MRIPGRRWLRVAAVTVLTMAGAAVPMVAAADSAPAGGVSLSATGSVLVQMRGNGHGHGLSQYGARGAAIAGRSYQQIVAFYYPGTTLKKLIATSIRVRLSGAGTTTDVFAAPKLVLTGVPGALPTAGVSRYRLIADSGTGLTLQRLNSAKASTWTTWKTGLPNRAEFHRSDGGVVRLHEAGGASTSYYSYLRTVRGQRTGATGGVLTVNRVGLDSYTAGVVPREMPSSWQPAAVNAQAVAARSYGRYGVEHPQSADYDICDTTSCQVYGGHAHYNSHGSLLWSGYGPAATATSNQVLQYQGATIFSQFSASNGGWSVDGGQRYLAARADPYDTSSSGDPYLMYSKVVTVASLARYWGFAKLTRITIATRDGHGAWGGRMTSGYADGTDRAGKAKRVRMDGFGLQAALGIGTTWISLTARS